MSLLITFPENSVCVNGRVTLLSTIANATRTSEEWNGRDEEVDNVTNQALKFLVHFYGELHMLLRMSGRARVVGMASRSLLMDCTPLSIIHIYMLLTFPQVFPLRLLAVS